MQTEEPTQLSESNTSVEWPHSFLRVGVARADVTPPVGIYHRMWGAAEHDRAEGVHRPLTATVLHLAPEQDSHADGVYLVALDHCLLWPMEMRQLLRQAAVVGGIPMENLYVCFSHTHAAGLLGRERQHLPGGELLVEYLDRLGRTLGSLIIQARSACQPGVVVYGYGRCSLGRNRDYYDSQRRQYVCGFNPAGVADDRVLVGRITDYAGRPIAVVVNYACHPTTLGWQNRLISPDYVGAMREVVEREVGAPCLFFQGASGDVGPREGFVGDCGVADRNGRQLGYAVLEALCDLPPPNHRFVYVGPVLSGATLGTWSYVLLREEQRHRARQWDARRISVRLGLRRDLPDIGTVTNQFEKWQERYERARQAGDYALAAEARARVEQARRWMTRLQHVSASEDCFELIVPVWRFGEAVWIALNGEYYNVLQRSLRDKFDRYALCIITLVNGSDIWYVPDSAAYGKGIYQVDTSMVDENGLNTIVQELTHTISTMIME
jgi:hypothetical protein